MAHTKRMNAPSFWGTGKKTAYWVSTPRPGRHAKDRAVPLSVVVRDLLKIANTAREARAIVTSGSVHVDGQVCKDAKTGLGLMDTVAFPGIGKTYRLLPSRKGLFLFEIPASEAAVKILKIVGKRTVSKGKTQITFHDGRTLLLDKGTDVKTGQSAVFNLKDGKVSKFLPLDKRTVVLVYEGAHKGHSFDVSEVKDGSAYSRPTVLLEAGRKSLETLKDYVIAIGVGKPEITIPKAEAD